MFIRGTHTIAPIRHAFYSAEFRCQAATIQRLESASRTEKTILMLGSGSGDGRDKGLDIRPVGLSAAVHVRGANVRRRRIVAEQHFDEAGDVRQAHAPVAVDLAATEGLEQYVLAGVDRPVAVDRRGDLARRRERAAAISLLDAIPDSAIRRLLNHLTRARLD
jgi:hypothetical protein